MRTRQPRWQLVAVLATLACAERAPRAGDSAATRAAGAPAASAAVIDTALADSLLQMGREDQAVREGIGNAIKVQDTVFMRRAMREDSVRTARLKAIVAAHGWPGAALVGADAAHAAWLLLQHAEDHEFQRSQLPAIEALARRGEVKLGDLALLTDRVLVRRGEKQRYGSQFSTRDGKLVADPIADRARLDSLRATMGLPPMAEYVKKLAEAYGMPVVWP